VVVDNCKSPDSISSVFAELYAQLYSSVPSEDEELSQISDRIQNRPKSSNERFILTRDDVTKAVHQMKASRREGDGLFSSDCILNAPDSLHVHLSLLLSAMLLCNVSTIVPIPKPKLDVCISSNYCGIALGLITGILIDLVLLQKLAHKLLTCDLQFGFKKRSLN
jgi:hypothetical protein